MTAEHLQFLLALIAFWTGLISSLAAFVAGFRFEGPWKNDYWMIAALAFCIVPIVSLIVSTIAWVSLTKAKREWALRRSYYHS